MTYQGTFLSETVTIIRTFGEPKEKTPNSHNATWSFDAFKISTTDGRQFIVRAMDTWIYNKVVNKVQINTF
jgi:hypothetical protein